MADKDLDELAKGLTKAAVGTAALAVAQTTAKKLTDQLTATLGAFDKQLTNALKDVDALTKGTGSFNSEAARAIGQARDMADAFDGLVGKLAPLSTILKDVGDRLAITAVSIRESTVAVNIHNETLTQLQAVSVGAANGQAAVSEALGKTQAAADKSSEKLKKVQETAGELGSSMIDAFTALASGEEPMKVLTDKGGEMAKTMLKAKLDGVNLVETFKTLGVATGILKVTTAEAAAAQVVGAAAFDATALAAEGATVATGELAAAETVALAPLGLALAGIAVIAGGVAGAFAVAAHDISGDVGDLTKDMGLTEEQMGRVKDKSVTMGDVAKATFEMLGDRLKAAFGPGLKALGDGFMSVYHTVTDVALRAAAFAVGAFAGAVQAIRVAWSVLPAAMGDIIISGVNFVLDGVGKMVNGAIGMANGLIGTVNWLAKKLGLSLQLPELGSVQVGKLTNQFEGAAKAAGGAISAAFGDGFKGGFDGIMNIPAVVAGRAVDIAKERIEEQAGKATDRIDQASAACSHGKDSENAIRRTNAAAVGRSDARAAASPADPVSAVQEAPIDGLRPRAVNVEGLATFVDPISESLDGLIKKLTDINALAPELGKQFEAAFGKSGKALGGLLTSFSAYSLEVAKIDREAAGRTLTAEEQAKRDQARIKGYEAMASAAKGFFKEGSDGYKAMQVAEIAFHTIETLNTIKSMALRGAETASAVTGEATKQAAFSATAYAKTLSSLPFPFNLVAGAAVLAALVQAGAAIKGKPGGGSVPGANDMKTRQEAQGSGSVLGDSKAKSESLEKALTHAQAYENKDLEYGAAMVRSLKSIDDQIGAVASALAKSFGAGGMLSTEGLNLGKTGTGATLSNLGFAKSTTRALQDQGIQFDAASLADIVAGGLSGSTYQQVLETTKKKAFGITTSSKSKVITETGSLDADFLDQVGRLIGSLGKGVAEAAKALGATDVEGLLASFKVDLGKLSFKDMTGTQIEEALNAIFGKLGDDMAKAAVPAIAEFQKVGEGAFETLVRVARQYEVIDTTLKSVGMTFATVGIASLEARERLVDLVGGLDNLTDQTAFFAEHFLTEEERLKPVKDAVAGKLTELKLPTDLTRQGFKDLVLKQDVSTEDGAKMYAALMALAPAFDKVATAAESATKASEDAAAATEAAAQATEQAARAQEERAASMKSLGDAIVSAMNRANELAASLRSLADELLGQLGATGETLSYGAAKANLVAGAGDAGKLEGLIRAFLDISKKTSSSTAAYRADVAWARGLALAEADRQAAYPQALVDFWRSINGFATGGSFEVGGAGPPDSKLFNLALSPGEMVNVRRPGAANDNGSGGLVAEIRALREEVGELRRTAGSIDRNTSKMESTLTNVTEGGRAMLTEAAS